MDIKRLDDMKKQCTRDEPVFCTNQCPLGVDVKKLASRIASGDFKGAYKNYSSQVLFPEIVSRICDKPCESACIRKKIDASVSIRMLEKACCDYAPTKKIPSFYVPCHPQNIGIVGGGLGGLSGAVKLAGKGYTVHLYEEKNRIGGKLWEQSGAISAQVIEAELGRIIHENKIILHLNTKIHTVNEIKSDAMYIATGSEGDDFGLAEGFDPVTLATRKKGAFISGSTMKRPERSVLIPIREGIRVAQSIESYLKIGTMGGAAGRDEVTPSRLTMDCSEAVKTNRIAPGNPNGYTREESLQEAERCLQCECDICMAACEVLAFYEKKPKKVIDDVSASLNAVASVTTKVASREINSCNACGLCREVCPGSLDFEEIFISSRRALHKGEKLPRAFHDFWMRDMAFSNSEEAFIVMNPHENHKSSYLFFPGCQLGGSDPDYVTNTYDYLIKQFDGEISMMVGCCGAPAEWAGRVEEHSAVIDLIKKNWENLGRPKVIIACPTCQKMFAHYLPDITVRSLWNIVAEKGSLEHKRIGAGKKVTVFDACASRNDPGVRTSIRKILKNIGYELEELPNSGTRAQCCGYGGQIQGVNRPLYDKIVNNRVKATPNDYVTYCTNCRDTFAAAGKPAVHILDLLFGQNIETRAARKPPTLTQRRENRIELKKDLQMQKEGIRMQAENNPIDRDRVRVFISPEVYDKMDKNFILAEDVRRTIAYCESTGNKILDTTTGHLIGHLQNGMITFWVIYKPEGDGFRLESTYSHRLMIAEELR